MKNMSHDIGVFSNDTKIVSILLKRMRVNTQLNWK